VSNNASRSYNIDVIKYLVKHGADCNAVSYDNTSPLHVAAMHGDPHAVQYLLEHGADKKHRHIGDCNAQDIAKMHGYYVIAANIEAFEPLPTKGVNS
jgi:ankyrin repeat protein